MERNIVICCDGTGNELNTNVAYLVALLVQHPSTQNVYYDPGVGTLAEPTARGKIGKLVSRVKGLAFGAGLDWKVGQAYSFLMDVWEPGDQIFLFGFSRGAFIVRVLGAMLHTIGLLPRGCHNLIPYAMRLFLSATQEGNISEEELRERDSWTKRCDAYRWTLSRRIDDSDARRCPVHFMGLWDTVSSIGWFRDPAKFRYIAYNPGVEIIRHAVSIDERRSLFQPRLFRQMSNHDWVEMWFPGVHSDIGGGYRSSRYSELWCEPFDWIRSEAYNAGLMLDRVRVDQDSFDRLPEPPSWAGPISKSLKGAWWLAEFFPRLVWDWERKRRRVRLGLGRHRSIPVGSLIHRSALKRLRERNLNYIPANLSANFVERVRSLPAVPESLLYEP